mgnify:CR=1 FL=1|jgi:Phage virion morphogenesis family.
MIRFRLEIQGRTEFDRAFNRVSGEIRDFTSVWDTVRAWARARLKRQFETEGAAGASRWQALSAKYKEWKEIFYPGARILERSGKMVESLVSGNAETIDRATKNEFDYGTSLPYAAYHQEGAGNLPQRKIFDFTERDRTELTKQMQRPLVRIVRQQGFEVFEF